MHRTICVKYRIVRRVDIDKAPLATFDTVDLGDEDIEPANVEPDSTQPTLTTVDSQQSCQASGCSPSRLFIDEGSLKSETIGGASSKKSLSQAGGEERESGDDRVRDPVGCVVQENVSGPSLTQTSAGDTSLTDLQLLESGNVHGDVLRLESVSSHREKSVEGELPGCTAIPALSGQGTIGRVHVPARRQDSDSSSSSPSSCHESAFTFQASGASVCHERATADGQVADCDVRKEGVDSLVPEFLDPSHILSPSKRKAYERRIERLKVTTSPIARPRSNTPINVVTLDEYAAISSPDTSPATAFIVQDKLKITLPTDEFTSKPKTPKLPTARRHDTHDTCFEFTEEFLFSRTKAALVVSDDGHLPLSPRRVLIPPNLTPTTSPQLSSSPKLTPDSFYEDLTPDTPYLKELQEIEATRKFFGTTVDETEEENWADFHDVSQADEDNDTSTSTVCDDTHETDLHGSLLLPDTVGWTTAAVTGRDLFVEPVPVESGSLFVESDSLFAESIPFKSANSPLDILEESLVCQQEHALHLATELGHGQPQDGLVQYPDSSPYLDTFHDSNLDSGIDLTHLGHSGSSNVTVTSVTPPEVSHLALDADLDSEEEILTVEINQSAEGREKHIGIEIRSTGNSASVSPVCSDWSVGQRSPDVEPFKAICVKTCDIQQEAIVSCQNKSDVNSCMLFDVVDTVSGGSDDLYALQQQKHSQCPLDTELCLVQTREGHCLSSPAVSPSTHVPSADLLSNLDQQLLQHSQPSQLPTTALRHQQQQQKQQQQPQRPPSTNPFDIDYEPPGLTSFGLQFQNPCTNPFLEHPPSTSSDLISFSFSPDTSSA